MSDSENDVNSAKDYTGLVASYARKSSQSAALESNAFSVEDEYQQFYAGGETAAASLIQPTFLPKVLRKLCTQNSTLPPCIEAMEVNIDGTGHDLKFSDATQREMDIAKRKARAQAASEGKAQVDNADQLKTQEALDAELESERELSDLASIFEECYPGVSFLSMRRAIRRDCESVGTGYMEVIRNVQDEVVFLRRIAPENLRMCRLDTKSVEVTKSIIRNGKTFDVRVNVRERRFAQTNGTSLRYFKEFGASRDLDKDTGQWADNGRLEASKRATEVIMFGAVDDPGTPYCLPRWISQLPSVLGQREAEELNLTYFDNGGIPPVLIYMVGGKLTSESHDLLKNLFSGSAKTKQAGVVIEAIPTSGSLDKEGKAELKVERFGSETQGDSMFDKYDDKCETKIRLSFRLPPLFIGKTTDYTYATAFASYMVAEEQVFSPERREFDQTINTTLMQDKSLGGGKYKYVSRPLTVKDIEAQLRVLEFAAGKNAITNEEYITQANSLTNMNMEFSGKEQQQIDINALLANANTPQDQNGAPQDSTGNQPAPDANAVAKRLKSEMGNLIMLASHVATVVNDSTTEEFKSVVTKAVADVPDDLRPALRMLVAKELFAGVKDRGARKLVEDHVHL